MKVQEINEAYLDAREFEKEIEEQLFYTRCKVRGKVCSVIIDSEICVNIASTEMVEKLKLPIKDHPSPYVLPRFYKSKGFTVLEQALVSFEIGSYHDELWCDIVPLDECHVLLGRPWQDNRGVTHDGVNNMYTLLHNKKKIHMLPLSPTQVRQDIQKRKAKRETERIIICRENEVQKDLETDSSTHLNLLFEPSDKGIQVRDTELTTLSEDFRNKPPEDVTIDVARTEEQRTNVSKDVTIPPMPVPKVSIHVPMKTQRKGMHKRHKQNVSFQEREDAEQGIHDDTQRTKQQSYKRSSYLEALYRACIYFNSFFIVLIDQNVHARSGLKLLIYDLRFEVESCQEREIDAGARGTNAYPTPIPRLLSSLGSRQPSNSGSTSKTVIKNLFLDIIGLVYEMLKIQMTKPNETKLETTMIKWIDHEDKPTSNTVKPTSKIAQTCGKQVHTAKLCRNLAIKLLRISAVLLV